MRAALGPSGRRRRRMESRLLVQPDFDPVRDVQFRGKQLTSLAREEALEALRAALLRVRDLELRLEADQKHSTGRLVWTWLSGSMCGVLVAFMVWLFIT